MALNNFEKQVQQKLSNHEIKPSENSWDRLDAMLSIEEKPKTKKGFGSFFIAASFLLFASIGFYFYNQSEVFETVNEIPIIVNVKSKSEIGNQKSEIIENTTEEVLVENDNKSEKSNQVVNQKLSSTSTSKISNNQLAMINQRVSIINQSKEDNANKVFVSVTNNQQLTTVNNYISAEKLLAEVSNTKLETKSSDKEIKNIKKRISVNPNTLLSNTESEIYQSFRENALERLNKNYNAIKTVLANRNYEDEL
jgi:hypothetical protein